MPKECRDPGAPVMARGRQIELRATVVRQRAMHVWVGQRKPRERLGDVAHLGLSGSQKLAADWSIEKKLSNLHRRANRRPAGRNSARLSAIHLELVAGLGTCHAGPQQQ